MFGNADFIAATRNFVCVRIDTYESEENERLVRDLMRGALVNTTFCLFAPNGDTALSGVGRSVFGPFANADGLARYARKYEPQGARTTALVPDFHSLRSALNVASADGRPLVLIVAAEEKIAAVEKSFRAVASHDDIVGRFHFDLETNTASVVEKIKSNPAESSAPGIGAHGIYVVRPDTFGLKGEVLARIKLDAPAAEIRKTLLVALDEFSETAERKTYESHVAAGRRRGIYLEMPIEYGEDRDADGEIDAHFSARFKRLRENARQNGTLIPAE